MRFGDVSHLREAGDAPGPDDRFAQRIDGSARDSHATDRIVGSTPPGVIESGWTNVNRLPSSPARHGRSSRRLRLSADACVAVPA